MMEGEEDEMDILPDTDVDRERSLTGKWALFVLVSHLASYRPIKLLTPIVAISKAVLLMLVYKTSLIWS